MIDPLKPEKQHLKKLETPKKGVREGFF